MEFTLGKAKLRFNKGFKPKSLPLFIKTYSKFGSEEELTKIYDKLNGNITRADKKPRKVKRKSDDDSTVRGDKESRG